MRQPNEQVKQRIEEFLRTKNLIQRCIANALSGEAQEVPSEEEFLRAQIFGETEPDVVTKQEQLEQIRRALAEADGKR
jgi:hypothetical protein